MSWETFWGPNLLQATLFAAISALVAAAVGLLAKRWFRLIAEQMFGEQQRATAAAETAASRAGEAIDHAASAAGSAQAAAGAAQTAGDNSRQANDALEWLAGQLANRDAVNEELRERIDRLLGTRARQLASEQHPPTGLLIPIGVADERDEATETGRHRLHTQHLPTFETEDFE